MQTSRFQLGLIASLAIGLGFSFSSSVAVGYPSGTAISTGVNPVVSASGHIDLSSATHTEVAVMTAPADQDLIITDVVVGMLQNSDGCRATGHFEVVDSEGNSLANVPIQNPHLANGAINPVQINLDSGLRVPAGRTVDLNWGFVYHYCGFTSYDLDWVLSGYLAAP